MPRPHNPIAPDDRVFIANGLSPLAGAFVLRLGGTLAGYCLVQLDGYRPPMGRYAFPLRRVFRCEADARNAL